MSDLNNPSRIIEKINLIFYKDFNLAYPTNCPFPMEEYYSKSRKFIENWKTVWVDVLKEQIQRFPGYEQKFYADIVSTYSSRLPDYLAKIMKIEFSSMYAQKISCLIDFLEDSIEFHKLLQELVEGRFIYTVNKDLIFRKIVRLSEYIIELEITYKVQIKNLDVTISYKAHTATNRLESSFFCKTLEEGIPLQLTLEECENLREREKEFTQERNLLDVSLLRFLKDKTGLGTD